MTERDVYMVTRKKKHITLKMVALFVGCSVSLLSRWENGTCEMSDDKFLRYKQFITG